MLAVVLEAELEAYLAARLGERDKAGRRLVVCNGHARPRQVTALAGAAEVAAPLAGRLIHLHGLSSQDFVAALAELSASMITRTLLL
jgi:hypothetical protein